MAARRNELTPEPVIDQLRYWRNVRLDNPSRKPEALRHIDNLLDEYLREKASDGT